MSVEIDQVGALRACAARAHEPIVLERKKNMDEPVGVDCYNMALTKDKAMTVGAAASDKNHVPCVIDNASGVDLYNQSIANGVAITVRNASGGDNKPAVLEIKTPTSFCIAGNVVDRNARQNGNGCKEECALTLNTTDRHAVATCFSSKPNASDELGEMETYLERTPVMENDTIGPLCARDYKGAGNEYVENGKCVVERCFSKTHRSASTEDPTKWEHREVANTLNTNDNTDVRTNELVVDKQDAPVYCVGNGQTASASTLKSVGPTLNTMYEPQQVLSKNQVRRLTPLECTRLQGFDDGWVDIGDWTDTKGKVHKESDSVKYKALGNSIALPFWQFLADRMVAILKRDGVENPKMCSLFDGIGGFPVVFSRAGCEPTWSSEIEEFPIAVTKKHFGDDDTGLKGDWSHLGKKPNYVTGEDVPPAQS